MTTLREAAQQALEALEGVVEYDYHGNPLTETDAACNDAINALLSALAEPVQEPVYWEVRCTAHPKWMRVDEQQFDEYVANGWEGQRLYTAPPQRKPLTEEEIERLWYPSAVIAEPGKRRVAFGRAVERAHGIGGEG